MSYIIPFQSVSLFENTFKKQINKNTGKIENRKFVFDKLFGDKEDNLPIEADRYRLIWMPGCPHSNKAVITLRLLGLDRVISIGECGVLRDPRGWVFSEDIGEVDPVLKIHYLDDAYLKGDPTFTGRSTVPAIVEEASGKVVQNDPINIPKYFVRDWKRFHKENAPDLYPEDLKDEIDEWSDFINHEVNAYGCGFALDQQTYDEWFERYFASLDKLEERLSDKRFVNGDHITLSDIHLYVALIRFHINYHLVFGVNKKRLEDYPNLWGYTRDLYQTEAFYEFTKLEWIKKHYQLSPHMRAKLGNVYGLIATGPDNSKLLSLTGRERLSSDPDNKFVYETNNESIYEHKDVKDEIEYLKFALIEPIERAARATYQNELERWAHLEADAFKEIDKRLKEKRYLLGDDITEADELLYKILKRHDHIYYYIYKLNFAKSFDHPNIKRYTEDLESIDRIKGSIDIRKETEEAYKALDDDRNPYHIIFRG